MVIGPTFLFVFVFFFFFKIFFYGCLSGELELGDFVLLHLSEC